MVHDIQVHIRLAHLMDRLKVYDFDTDQDLTTGILDTPRQGPDNG